jgi:AraC-like DNA-binding protein
MGERKQLRPRPALRRSLGLLGVAVLRVEPEPNMATHGHDVLELVLVERGGLEHHLAGRTVPGPPDSLLVVPPGSQHTYRATAPDTVLWNLLLDTERVLPPSLPPALAPFRHLVLRPAGAGPVVLQGVSVTAHLQTMRDEQARALPGWEPIMLAAFHIVVLTATRAAQAGHYRELPAPDSRIAALAQQIADNPGEDWSLPRLATLAGLGVPGLVRAFHRTAGCAPAAYVRGVRVRAAQALVQSGASSADAAAAVGYGSASALAHALRRVPRGGGGTSRRG